MTYGKRGARFGLAVLGAGMLSAGGPAIAQNIGFQPNGAAPQESPGDALARNLRSLAANPRSVDALTGAGRAALEVGDAQAALSFLARAEDEAPRDGRIKMWIGSALVQLEQPHAALKFFRDAVELGAPEAELARDRGLAYDITGDQRRAQRDYRLVLQRSRDPEAARRLALSLAISGERDAALRVLDEQLPFRDAAAERTRALVLALGGDVAGAERTMQGRMGGAQAAAMAPFLARLPALSPADRALAVHLGHFPQAGGSEPSSAYAMNNFRANVASSAPGAAPNLNAGRPDPLQPGLGRSTGALVRAAPPQGQRSTSGPSVSLPSASAPPLRGVAPAIHMPQRQIAAATPPIARQPQAAATPPPFRTPQTTAVTPAPSRPAQVTAAAPNAAGPTAPVPSQAASAPTGAVQGPPASVLALDRPLDISRGQPANTARPAPAAEAAGAPPVATPPSTPPPAASAQPIAPPVANAPAVAPPVRQAPRPSRLADLAATVATIKARPAPHAKPPAAEPTTRKAAATAETAKKPTAPAKKTEPKEPSRHWVQVGIGDDEDALPTEFSRLKAKGGKLLAARAAWTAAMGETNRILVGPFPSKEDAQDFVNELAEKNLRAFAWTSPAGEKVAKLPAK